MNIAIIDQGTSSSKLFVFDVSGKEPILIKKDRAETRLGQGLGTSGVILDEAKERTIEVLNSFKKTAKELGVGKIRVISTEVMRQAANRDQIERDILEKTGLEIKVLSQKDETKVFWHGMTHDFKWDKHLAAIDIGGGSVQFMWGKKDKLEGYKLLKTGVLVLRERFVKEEPPKNEDYEKIEDCIEEEIAGLNIKLGEETPLIHGSTSVLEFYQEANIPLKNFGYSKAHPKKTDLADTNNFYLKTRNYGPEERAKLFPSHPGFMDGAYIGLVNVLLIANKTGIKYELPSDKNIIHGIVLLMQNNEFDRFLNID